MLAQSVAVEIDAGDVEPVSSHAVTQFAERKLAAARAPEYSVPSYGIRSSSDAAEPEFVSILR